MNKKQIIASTIAGTALFAVGQHAQAADVESPVQDMTQKDATTQNIESEKAKLADVKAEQGQVETELTQVDAQFKATTAELEATKQTLAETPEQDIDPLKDQLTVAETKVIAQEDKVYETKEDVDKSQHALDEATAKMRDAEKTVIQEKAPLDQLNQQIAPVNTQKLTHDLETAKTDVTTKTEAVNNAQHELEVAQQQVQKVEAEKAQVTQQVNATTQTINTLDAQIEEKTNELSKLDNAFEFPTEIKLTPEFIEAFNRLVAARENDDDAAWENAATDLSNLATVNREMNMLDKENIPRGPKVHDVRNLSDDVKIELNQYFVTLVNNMHHQLGDGKIVYVNKNAITLADDIAREYEKNGGAKPSNGHNKIAINNAGLKNNILSVPESIGYDLIEKPNYEDNNVSIEELKRIIYYHTIGMLLDDASHGFGHTFQIINKNTVGISFSIVDGIDKEYYQTKFDDIVLYDENNIKSIGLHITSVDRTGYIKANSRKEQKQIFEEKYSVNSKATLPLVTPKTNDTMQQREVLTQDIQKLNGQLTQEKAKQQDLQLRLISLNTQPNDVSTKQQALTDAKVALTQAKDKVAQLTTQLDHATTRKENQDQIKASITTQEERLANAEKVLSHIYNDVKGLTHDLDVANKAYTQAVAELNANRKTHANAYDALEQAKQNNTTRQTLTEKMQHLTVDQAQYQATMDVLNAKLDQLKQTATTLENLIFDLETKAFISGQTDVLPIKPEVKPEVKPENSTVEKPKIKQEFVDDNTVSTSLIKVEELTNETTSQVVESSETINDIEKVVTTEMKQLSETANHVVTIAKQAPLGKVVKSLPQTGEAPTQSALAGMSLLLVAGLFRKKNKATHE